MEQKQADVLAKEFAEELAKAKSYNDLFGNEGAIKKMMKSALEAMLEAELTEHLGYERSSPAGYNSGDSRNGTSKKTLKNDHGEIELDIPRDRNGSFNPKVVRKYQRTVGPIEEKIIAMYARGMTVRDIQSFIEEIYGLEVSATFISNVTNQMLDLAKEWQNRPLDACYPVVFFDAVFCKVQDDGRVTTKASYTALGIDIHGKKDLLGIWIMPSEGSNFWTTICTELKSRGVKEILVACVDGLNGFPDAIQTVFPNTDIQLCVIHMVRNTMKHIVSKDRRPFLSDLRAVYAAPTEEAAELNLQKVEKRWGEKYSLAVANWRKQWPLVTTYFRYPVELRKVIYTTNAVEQVHRQYRKVTKAKSLFPNDDALRKMLYLVYRELAKKWKGPIPNWALIYSHISRVYADRLPEIVDL